MNRITEKDLALMPDILQYASCKKIPLRFVYGDRTVRGIPKSFSPSVSRRILTANTIQVIIEGTDAGGLQIRAEYLEYRDFPVTEWVFYFTNRGNSDTPILKKIRIEGELVCPDAVLEYGNGDTQREDGYHFWKQPVEKKFRLTPTSGTPCEGAFPYLKLHGTDREIRAAIGWPTKWAVEIAPRKNGVRFSCGQDRCATVLHPGETYRTPRLNLMVYTNENAPYRGINLWRHWYFKHILPRENGQPIPPKLILHHHGAQGMPEFTGATEENQLHALKEYLRRGIKPDVWWIDAGWYPCNGDWQGTGTWRADFARFPNGLAPIGKLCEKNGIQFLLWFEPERIRAGEELDREHPDWMLGRIGHTTRLLDLGNPKARKWLIEHFDRLIKDWHIRIYRQDFNTDPLPIWIENEANNRIGMIENLHAQGYLALWDELLSRNPGLWIDSCSSGGRRNDLESMRRAVPLHYTDVGYGNHPIKQNQFREMFEWIPYFRSHSRNWDKPDGTYRHTDQSLDEFAYYGAITPGISSMVTYNDTEEHFKMVAKMHQIWREAAELELSGDYYPITECRGDPHDWYAMQFDNEQRQYGFVQITRNTLAEDTSYFLKMPCVYAKKHYTFTDRETGECFTYHSKVLIEGINITLPKRKSVVYFYTFQ